MSVSKQAFRTLAVLAVVGIMAAAAVAQPPGGGGGRGGRGGRGGGFGGFGGGRGGFGIDSTMLLMNEKVQEDLKLEPDQLASIQEISDEAREARQNRPRGNFQDLSDEERREQMEKMREEMEKTREETTKKINEVLTDDQEARLEQISLQIRGVNALTDEKVQEKLGFDADQKEKLEAAQEENQTAMREAFQDFGRDGDPEERQAKMEELRKSADEKLMAVLTDEQKTKFEEMKGEKIELTMQDFFRGRGGPGGGGFGPGGQGGGGRRGGGRGGDRGEN